MIWMTVAGAVAYLTVVGIYYEVGKRKQAAASDATRWIVALTWPLWLAIDLLTCLVMLLTIPGRLLVKKAVGKRS